MATGDIDDMASRIHALTPARWFPPLSEAPVLNGLLSGIGAAWAFCYGLLGVARSQARLSTASGAFLDMIAGDFFGDGMPRLPLESDGAFRARIASGLLRERATRAGLVAAVQSLTGSAVSVFEPVRPQDTGGYGAATSPAVGGGLGYGVPGQGYGTLAIPFQIFITVQRPREMSEFAAVAGYADGTVASVSVSAAGGYGQGALEYLDLGAVRAVVTDARIMSTITATLPAGVVAWTRLV